MCQKHPFAALSNLAVEPGVRPEGSTYLPRILGGSIAVGADDGAGPVAGGSRRRRLWELNDHAHCPVIGVCLSLAVVRKIVARVWGEAAREHTDYDCHCMAVTESKRRTPAAELIQRELDERFALAIRAAAKLKTEGALRDWWLVQAQGTGLAQAFWVTLTHPRCTPALTYQVLGQVHMLQHQVGVATRVDQSAYDEALRERVVLMRHIASAQDRCSRMVSEHAAKVESLESALMQARAEALARQTACAQLRDELSALQSAQGELPQRLELSKRWQAAVAQAQDLRRQLQQATEELGRLRSRLARQADRGERSAQAPLRPAHDQPWAAAGGEPRPLAQRVPNGLVSKSVLCVGGRAAVVPIYREVVEREGAHFMHHDGGEKDGATALDANLAAADLVICQTGCISHNAYWRVKAHCKRTGTRCVFIDTPSRTALSRALSEACVAAVTPLVEGSPG